MAMLLLSGRPPLPPGPSLPRPLQTLRFWSRPEPFLRACRARYGDVFTVDVEPNGHLVLVADPTLVREVFTGPTDLFHAGEGNDILAPILGRRSLLVLDEDDHLRRRKLMLPAFHGEHVRRQVGLIREISAAEVDSWPLGQPFRLLERTQRLTLEVILRVVFGVHDEARLARLRVLLPQVSDVKAWLLLQWSYPALQRVGPWRRYGRLLDEVDAVLRDEIARRRREPDLDERPDVLSMLVRAADEEGVGMDDGELRDQLVTLLMAGHETTATALAWAYERLVRRPEVAARVDAAVAGEDDAYLDAVVKETLRVRPIIDRVARRTTRPVVLGGHALPAGTLILPAVGLIQLDPAHHPEPAEFRPERWLDRSPPPPYTWLPFGGGVRRCLGATFASVEMREVIRVVTQRAHLRAVHPEPERQRGRHITIVPQHGALVERVG